jgi:hypothetical protein
VSGMRTCLQRASADQLRNPACLIFRAGRLLTSVFLICSSGPFGHWRSSSMTRAPPGSVAPTDRRMSSRASAWWGLRSAPRHVSADKPGGSRRGRRFGVYCHRRSRGWSDTSRASSPRMRLSNLIKQRLKTFYLLPCSGPSTPVPPGMVVTFGSRRLSRSVGPCCGGAHHMAEPFSGEHILGAEANRSLIDFPAAQHRTRTITRLL